MLSFLYTILAVAAAAALVVGLLCPLLIPVPGPSTRPNVMAYYGPAVFFTWMAAVGGPDWQIGVHLGISLLLLPGALIVGLVKPAKVPFGRNRKSVAKNYGSAFLVFLVLMSFLPWPSKFDDATRAYESADYAAAAELLYTIGPESENYEPAQELLVSVEGRFDSLVEEATRAAEGQKWRRVSVILDGIPSSYPRGDEVRVLRQRAEHHELLDVGRRALGAEAFVAALSNLSKIPETAETYSTAQGLMPAVEAGIHDMVRDAERTARAGDRSTALEMVRGIPPEYLNMGRVREWRAVVEAREQAIRDSLQTLRDVQRRYVHVGTRVRERPTTSSAIVQVLAPNAQVWAGEARANGWIPVYDERHATPKGFIRGDLLHSSRRRQATSRTRKSEYVLRTGYGGVPISSSRDWWDDAHTIAVVAEGTRAELLARVRIEDMPGFAIQRCRVRTMSGGRITGWVMCGDVSRR